MTRATLLVPLALLATACSSVSGDYYATDVDVRRAQLVWSDPWVAPDRPSVPRAGWGTDGQVDRLAGTRRTVYTGVAAREAVTQEVAAALDAGWSLVGATCSDDGVRAVLTRGGTDLEEAAVAQVSVDTDGALRGDDLAVDVAAEVPHHLDDDWPDLGPAVEPGGTCLAGGSGDTAPELPDGTPRGEADDGVDVPSWSDDGPDAAERARLDAAAADPWVASLGAPAPEVDTEGGHQTRHAPFRLGTLTPGPAQPAAAIAAVVGDMDGWALTWAACSPASGAAATLRLTTDDGPVVARLTAPPGREGQVDWEVAVPVVDGPDLGWIGQVPALAPSACLDDPPPTEPVVEGTPVAVPESQQPMQ